MPQLNPEPIVTPSPSPSPRRAPPLPATGLEGTITLDIDPTTGLIAVETCPIIRTKTFVLGTEPKKYCGPEYHRGRTIDPAGPSRPRRSEERRVGKEGRARWSRDIEKRK